MGAIEGSDKKERGAAPAPPVDVPISDRIRRGEASVESVYAERFSTALRVEGREIRALRSDRVDELIALAVGLEGTNLLDLLRLLADGFFRLRDAGSDDFLQVRPAIRDMLVAGEIVAARRDLDRSHPVVEAILAALTDLSLPRHDGPPSRGPDIGVHCREIVVRCGRLESARRYLDFVLECARLTDRGLPEDDARAAAAEGARRAFLEIAATHAEPLEARLVEMFASETDFSARTEVLYLLGSIGGARAFEALAAFVRSEELASSPSLFRFAFWSALLWILERLDFPLECLRRFNDAVSHVVANPRLMLTYHGALGYFAACLRDKEVDLFERLEQRGMQFWDYWLVYRKA